jgi:GT2 family glycosyltransferase
MRAASPQTGAVVIGRNEGANLRACLASVLPQVERTVYVDSGSTDGSVALAKEAGAEVIELCPSIPFTAARARNVGWKRLVELNGETQFIQFVDGDCELNDTWIDHAVDAIAAMPETAIVSGHLMETQPNRNVYHRLAAMEWDTPVGVANYCGGIALIRTAALTQAGGFRDDLLAGEEPELCVRLRQSGWNILKLAHVMASHDCAINSFGQWWRRSVRAGRAYAQGAALHGASPERHWVKERRSIWIWGILVPSLAVVFTWLTYGLSLVVMLALYVVLGIKIVLNRTRSWGYSRSDAVLYAWFCVIGKWPQAIGLLQFVFEQKCRPNNEVVKLGRPHSTGSNVRSNGDPVERHGCRNVPSTSAKDCSRAPSNPT